MTSRTKHGGSPATTCRSSSEILEAIARANQDNFGLRSDPYTGRQFEVFSGAFRDELDVVFFPYQGPSERAWAGSLKTAFHACYGSDYRPHLSRNVELPKNILVSAESAAASDGKEHARLRSGMPIRYRGALRGSRGSSSITAPSERGTVYQPEEHLRWGVFAHERGMSCMWTWPAARTRQ